MLWLDSKSGDALPAPTPTGHPPSFDLCDDFQSQNNGVRDHAVALTRRANPHLSFLARLKYLPAKINRAFKEH